MAELLSASEMFATSWEPTTQNRFIVYIDGISSFLVKKLTMPKINSNVQEIHYINMVTFVKGKSKWGSMSMTLYNPVVPSGLQQVYEWYRLAYESVTGRAGYMDFYKKDIIINQLGPVGDKVSEYLCKGVLPVNIGQSDGDWTSDNLTEITVELQPDYCILQY